MEASWPASSKPAQACDSRSSWLNVITLGVMDERRKVKGDIPLPSDVVAPGEVRVLLNQALFLKEPTQQRMNPLMKVGICNADRVYPALTPLLQPLLAALSVLLLAAVDSGLFFCLQ